LNKPATNIPSECRLAIIGSHDAMILPHDANPGRIKFSERMGLERDHNMDLRFAAFVGFVLHNDAHYDFRILCARLRPLVLNNLQLFGLCEHPLHEYRPVPFRRSYPDVVVVQPGQEWNGDNGTGALESLRRCWKSTPEGDQSSHPNGAITKPQMG